MRDLLGSVYPSVTGARSLFYEAGQNGQTRAQALAVIAGDRDLKERAQEGLQYRADYLRRVTDGLEGEMRDFMVSPYDAAIASASRFLVDNFRPDFKPPPAWQVLRDAWSDTVLRFGLNPSMTPTELERQRDASDINRLAWDYYQLARRRLEFSDVPGHTNHPKPDLIRWKSYYTGVVRRTREENLRRALVAAAALNDATVRSDFMGREETRKAYYSEVVPFMMIADSLRVQLRVSDFAAARITVMPAGDFQEGAELPEQGVYSQRGGTARLIARLVKSLFSAHQYFKWAYRLPKDAVRSAFWPLTRAQIGFPLTPKSGDQIIVAFDPTTLNDRAKELLKPTGYVLKFAASEFSSIVLEKMFTNSVLHYQSKQAREKRFVAEASLRDLQMSQIQGILEQDRNEEFGPFIKEFKMRQRLLDEATALDTYPVALIDETRTDARLSESQRGDLLTGLKWWGNSIFPAYWVVRDAVAAKHGRPDYKKVLTGEVRAKTSEPWPRPISRLASHYRTGSRVKRAVITAGVLGLLYMLPQVAQPVRDATGSALSGLSQMLPKLSSGSRGGNSSSSDSAGRAAQGQAPNMSKYTKPGIAPKSERDAGATTVFFRILPGPRGLRSRPHFFALDEFEHQLADKKSGYEIAWTGRAVHVTDPFAKPFEIKPAEKADADYYIETEYEIDTSNDKVISVPLAPNHRIVSFEYESRTYKGWFYDGYARAAFEVNGYGFLRTSLDSRRIRIGYKAPAIEPAVPTINKGLDRNALAAVTQQLAAGGFAGLSQGVQKLLNSGDTVTLDAIEETFATHSAYVWELVGQPFGDPKAPFYGLTQFLKDGGYFTQCTGAFEMLRTFTDQYRIAAKDFSFGVQPYVGLTVSPDDPMEITAGGGHIVARFVQASDGSAKIFDSTPASSASVSKRSNPWNSPQHRPKADMDNQPWNRRRRELWLGLVEESRAALDHLNATLNHNSVYIAKLKTLRMQLKALRAAIIEAKPTEKEHLQSPAVGLLEVLPDLVLYRSGKLTWPEIQKRLLTKLSPFIRLDLDPTSVSVILGDFYHQSSAYFRTMNDHADHHPEKIIGLDSHVNQKLQKAILEFASALYHTNFDALPLVPISRSCESSLLRPDSEYWGPWEAIFDKRDRFEEEQ